MNDFYSVMEKLLDLEYTVKAHNCILSDLEAHYSEETCFKVKSLVSLAKWENTELQTQIRYIIERFDELILMNKKS